MKKVTTLKRMAIIIVLILTATVLFTACSSTNNDNSNLQTTGEKQNRNTDQSEAQKAGAGNLNGTIAVVGSTSVAPLAQDLADEFNKIEPNLRIDIQAVGSTTGIKAVSDGSGDIGMSSRDLNDEEKNLELKEYTIALDGIAVVIHPSNPISDLTPDQVSKIFRGEISNWKDIGGSNKEIIVVSREAGSGTRGAFEELLKLQQKKDAKIISLLKSDALIAEGNGSVKANISSKENAIGYISLGYIDNTVKPLKISGIEPTVENIKTRKYTVMRPFIMLTKGETAPEANAYLDFILSDKGQEIVKKHYITVNR